MKPCVLIPSYNTGAARLRQTVREALAAGWPVRLVIDGSRDGSDAGLEADLGHPTALRVLRLPRNGGKGAAVHAGVRAALGEGFTHALAMDADGQHPAEAIPRFLAAAAAQPQALVMGRPRFGADAPWIRLNGRKLTLALTAWETADPKLGDTLFGLRVYPLEPLNAVLDGMRFGRGYDFDPEVAVRLRWRGLPVVQVEAACRYVPREEGGVSHFHYLRDNLKMLWLHARLLPTALIFRLGRGRATAEPRVKSEG